MEEEQQWNTQTAMLVQLYNLIGRNLGLDRVPDDRVKPLDHTKQEPIQEWTHRMKDKHLMELEIRLVLETGGYHE
jgi:hypothetical protein